MRVDNTYASTFTGQDTGQAYSNTTAAVFSFFFFLMGSQIQSKDNFICFINNEQFSAVDTNIHPHLTHGSKQSLANN